MNCFLISADFHKRLAFILSILTTIIITIALSLIIIVILLIIFSAPFAFVIPEQFRDKVKEFTDLLSQNHIPLLIFSAGLGDVIQLLLQRFSMDTNNVRVVSNFMRFNNEVCDTSLLIPIFLSPVVILFSITDSYHHYF